MGTEIFKIDAEMAEKIEVEVGNPHLKTDRKAWLMMWFSKIMAPTVPIKTSKRQPFDFGPTFTHFYLLKNVNFKIQFVLRFVL